MIPIISYQSLAHFTVKKNLRLHLENQVDREFTKFSSIKIICFNPLLRLNTTFDHMILFLRMTNDGEVRYCISNITEKICYLKNFA